MLATVLRVLAIVLVVPLSGCLLEWTEDSRGNLNSVGLPGLPVWKASKPEPNPHQDELEADASGSPRPWLAELNKWRVMAGTTPVGENLALSHGCQLHAEYLVGQVPPGLDLAQYVLAMGSEVHEERVGMPGYSEEGAQAASGGKYVEHVRQAADVSWGEQSQKRDIDGLIVAPFHRLSLLAPWAKVAGFGRYGAYPKAAAALALRGPDETGGGGMVQFPPEGSTVPMTEMLRGEWPNPVAACSGYSYPVGLPVTLQLGSDQQLALSSYSFRDETDGRRLEACAFDSATYSNPDPVQQQHGRESLQRYGAVFLIPREPLKPNHAYKVSLDSSGHNYSWTFTVGSAQSVASNP